MERDPDLDESRKVGTETLAERHDETDGAGWGGWRGWAGQAGAALGLELLGPSRPQLFAASGSIVGLSDS